MLGTMVRPRSAALIGTEESGEGLRAHLVGDAQAVSTTSTVTSPASPLVVGLPLSLLVGAVPGMDGAASGTSRARR
jgi:hypothetical protein